MLYTTADTRSQSTITTTTNPGPVERQTSREAGVEKKQDVEWNVWMCGMEGGLPLRPFRFSASMVFTPKAGSEEKSDDDPFMNGVCCVPQELVGERAGDGGDQEEVFGRSDLDMQYALVEFETRAEGGEWVVRWGRCTPIVQQHLDEKVNALQYWPRQGTGECAAASNWLVAVSVDHFLLVRYHKSVGQQAVEGSVGDQRELTTLRLPADVRNIPIKPMHTTSTMALACGDTVFVAGMRRALYIWNVESGQLVRTVDAHFGRILNLQALEMQV